MAKRYKKDEEEDEEDLDIDLEFDEEEYMKKEILKGKSTLISVAIAPIFGIVSWYVFTLTMDGFISLFAGMFGIVFFKPLYQKFNIDTSKIDKKGWIKNFGVYFFTLLAVWIILMNPPFSDFAEPEIGELQIEEVMDMDDNLVELENVTEDEEYNVTLRVEITSNSDLLTLEEGGVEAELDGREKEVSHAPNNNHEYLIQIEELSGNETYELLISAEDVNDNRNENARREFYLGIEEEN